MNSYRTLVRGLLFTMAATALALPASAQSAAESAWANQDRATAKRLYLASLQQDSTDVTALFRLALLEGWSGHHAESLAYIERILRITPGDVEVRATRARTLAALGRFHEGMALADSLLRAHPGDVVALQTRARFAYWNGDVSSSEALWRRALAADARNAETRIGLSQSLRRQGRFRDAWEIIGPTRERVPTDTDVREEHAWVAQSLRPRLRATAGHEADSDGNAMTTFVLSGGVPAGGNVQVRADAYLRDATLEGVTERTVTARGAGAAAGVLFGAGWLLELNAGASRSDAAGAETLPAFGLTLLTPRRSRTVATFSMSRAAWDYTAPMADNQVLVDEGRLALDLLPDRNWNVTLTAGLARFDVRRLDQDNRRWTAQAQYLRMISDRASVALGARAFGFNEDLDGGYYDPDFYGLADVRFAYRIGSGGWTLDADVAPGVQKSGSAGDPKAALHAAADLGYTFRPGRRIGIRGIYANTGLNQLSPSARRSYRYAAIALTFAWWLGP
jgi:tetratricopeptide (TPR) repeat protein